MGCGSPHETSCAEVLSLIDIYIDDELEVTQHVIVATHLSECPPCAGNALVLQSVRAVVRRAARPGPAPGGLSTRVVAALRAVSITTGETDAQKRSSVTPGSNGGRTPNEED